MVIKRIGLVGNKTWAFRRELVNRLAIGVKDVGRDSAVKTMFKLRRQCIEICVGVRCEGEYVVNTWIERWVEVRQVLNTGQVMSRTPLVAYGHYPILWQAVLHLRR